MDVARENALAGRVRFEDTGRAVPSGVRAEEQTAGRGQRGREWFARRGECLCATYYLRLDMETPERAGQLAFVAGVAVAETLAEWKTDEQGTGNREQGTEEKTEDRRQKTEEDQSAVGNRQSAIGLKWPNDIMLNGRKLGGILIELARCDISAHAETRPQEDWPQVFPTGILYAGSTLNSSLNEPTHPTGEEWIALIGVGINVRAREFPAELEGRATSLWREGVEDCDIGELAEEIGRALQQTADLWRTAGFEAILPRWQPFDTTSGRVFTTMVEGKNVQGMAEGIEADGKLRLRLADGRVLHVLSASSLQET